jgi:hypothetical protein
MTREAGECPGDGDGKKQRPKIPGHGRLRSCYSTWDWEANLSASDRAGFSREQPVNLEESRVDDEVGAEPGHGARDEKPRERSWRGTMSFRTSFCVSALGVLVWIGGGLGADLDAGSPGDPAGNAPRTSSADLGTPRPQAPESGPEPSSRFSVAIGLTSLGLGLAFRRRLRERAV